MIVFPVSSFYTKTTFGSQPYRNKRERTMGKLWFFLLSSFFLFDSTICNSITSFAVASASASATSPTPLLTPQRKEKKGRRQRRRQLMENSGSSSKAKCPRIESISSDGPSLNGDDPSDPENRRFNEISGMAFSSKQFGPSDEPIFYVINDGPAGRLGVYDSGTGKRLRTWDLTDTIPPKTMRDWEDMTYGSCGYSLEDKDDTSISTASERAIHTTGLCIYIGDVGDNVARAEQGTVTGRNNEQPYRIIKIQEPIWNKYDDNESLPSSMIKTLPFNYRHPESPTRYADCEAIFLDFGTGDLYLLPKWDLPESRKFNRLFYIPAETWKKDWEENSFSIIPIDLREESSTSSISISGETWTRADMSSDGSLITLGTYDDAYLFIRCSARESVKDMFERRHCRQWDNLLIQDARQFESIAFTPDGSRILQISECQPKCDPPMIWTKLMYPNHHSLTCRDQDEDLRSTSKPSLSSYYSNSSVSIPSPISEPPSSISEPPSSAPTTAQTFSPLLLRHVAYNEAPMTTTNPTSSGMKLTNLVSNQVIGWFGLILYTSFLIP